MLNKRQKTECAISGCSQRPPHTHWGTFPPAFPSREYTYTTRLDINRQRRAGYLKGYTHSSLENSGVSELIELRTSTRLKKWVSAEHRQNIRKRLYLHFIQCVSIIPISLGLGFLNMSVVEVCVLLFPEGSIFVLRGRNVIY